MMYQFYHDFFYDKGTFIAGVFVLAIALTLIAFAAVACFRELRK
jgi:hypothetical protein